MRKQKLKYWSTRADNLRIEEVMGPKGTAMENTKGCFKPRKTLSDPQVVGHLGSRSFWRKGKIQPAVHWGEGGGLVMNCHNKTWKSKEYRVSGVHWGSRSYKTTFPSRKWTVVLD